LQSGARFRLSEEHDKHPTWSPDGRRIYFHTAVGGKRHRFDFFARGVERAVLGFYQMHFEDGRFSGCDRVLVNELADDFVYHKHPTIVAGTGLLFFHGRLKPGGKMKLMVSRDEPGSQVFVVKPTLDGEALKALKHPCSSFERADLVFIAKPKGDDDYNMLLALTEEALGEIARVVNARGPSLASDETPRPVE
jgi:dipeptidyl aminopeptidase/acylaminoacyl peptidase